MPRPPEWFKKLSIPLADKIVYASGAYVSMKSTLNDLSATLVTFEGEPQTASDERLLAFASRIRPMTGSDLELIRVGGPTDGGYVMAKPLTGSGALSIGVGADVSWDQEIAARGIPVAMFDHTIRKPPVPVPNSTFHRIGIGSMETRHLRPLDQLVSLTGWAGRDDLLLKMDVEGAEWSALTQTGAVNLESFTQIVIELHGLGVLRDERTATAVFAAIEHLCASHIPIHVHANNYDELVRFGSWWFPDAIEVSFIRRDLLPLAKPASELRTDLDAPCDPRVTEIDLSALTRF